MNNYERMYERKKHLLDINIFSNAILCLHCILNSDKVVIVQLKLYYLIHFQSTVFYIYVQIVKKKNWEARKYIIKISLPPPQIGDIVGQRGKSIGERNVEAFGRTGLY